MKTLLLIGVILLSGHSHSQNWTQITDYSGSARDDGTSFTIGNKAYCGTGRNVGFNMTSDFKAFDLGNESWSIISSLPAAANRQYATSFVFNEKGYVFGGINNLGNYLNDIWEYDPLNDTWSELTNMPDVGRSGASSFVIGDTAYIIGGKSDALLALTEVWAYDIVSGNWVQKSDVPSFGMWRGMAVALDNRGYIGFGKDVNDDTNIEFFEYNPAVDLWTSMPGINLEARSYPIYAQIGDSLYIYGGVNVSGDYLNSFERVDLNTWNVDVLNSFPSEARRGSMPFCSTTNFYMTTGLTTTNRLDETWVARNVVGIEEEEFTTRLIWVGDELKIISDARWTEIELISLEGKVLYSEESSEILSVNMTNRDSGLLFYRLRNNSREVKGRIFLVE
jgi:N-acetylneuraminic acid mutarotase